MDNLTEPESGVPLLREYLLKIMVLRCKNLTKIRLKAIREKQLTQVSRLACQAQ